jgi:predicted CopG family antitoxin
MNKSDKVKVELDREIVNELLGMKSVGDSYSDVIRRLLEKDRGG